MFSTMQDLPLNLSRILTHGATAFGHTKVTTWEADKLHETTYSEIAARAAALAHALRDELGITADQRVGTFMHNCAEHLESLFAVACMGAVFNPLNKQLMNDQIAHIINHAEDEVIIADQRLAKQLGVILERGCPTVRAVVFIGRADYSPAARFIPEHIKCYSYEALLDGRSTTYHWPVLPENTAAALCYSTGTTGAPKGVVYSHRSMYLQSLSLRTTDSLSISHGQSFLCCVPIYHVLSWGVPIAAFMSGTPLVFPGADMSPESLAQLIATTHPRVANGVPTVWIQLMVYYMNNPPARMSLQEIFSGGSAVPPILMHMWEERYGVDVIQVWGMTETSSICSVARPPTGVSGEAREAYRISQGRFPASVEYRVVNDGEVVPTTDRNHGEIQVRGNWVTGSYYHSPSEESGGSAHTFRNHAVDDAPGQFTADGWLRTGDVGSVTSDAYLTIHDRARDVIRSGGEWIYSTLLENEIMGSTEVVECAVIGYPDTKWGERPLAVTVVTEGVERTKETAERLRAELKDSFPSWMLPEYWAFVDAIDKTSVGKFDKIDLREHVAKNEFDVIALRGPGRRLGEEVLDSDPHSTPSDTPNPTPM
ncbi:long-chain fatty-acid--CoA ligase [Corynebacterium felinum]|uniref:Fatty-acyl-CoA synthase n=1 Tax=Corynebacterium felinum TaxID=131318 RepID=A0ABU2BAK0_9CORY|nr:long-chain fatty-acid--CoA ligase [Corynebacterium felinum]MDF5821872.1 long-chain fatty-acid--CoA ligase [Corynebacterium felinum]MDR7355316.1 fatty-acyl-CoA synthase [Corynebacterium felinum]WJY94669.1 Long-chain-fatty-acid--CoA ligase [Corynebacterium felinum]